MTIENRDGSLQSPWQRAVVTAEIAGREPRLEQRSVYDCLIVGGGITGLTAALTLQLAGKQTILAEAHRIGFGTTGGTSAHINTFADTTFSEAEKAFGGEGARLFADALRDGLNLIKNNSHQFNIECDLASVPAYLYAESEDQEKLLADIRTGAIKVGVDMQYTDQVPAPVPYRKALLIANQAQFHPLRYLKGLEKAYLQAGGILLEDTLVEKTDTEDGVHTAIAAGGEIRANNLIYATHIPPNINVLNFECAPYRSYVMAVKLHSGHYPDALIYDTQEPYHYIRTHRIDTEPLLIIGGQDHKTGHDDPEKAFAELEKYARKYYNISSVKYRWSSQYYVPVDGLPYIGQMPFLAKGIFCATGYNGNGMMLGSIAGKILADLAAGIKNRYADLFTPSRVKPIDSFSEFVKENADVAYHFVTDRFGLHETDSLKRLEPGSGKLVEYQGKKIAAFRDENGEIHALHATCTHAGCIVNWNSAEKTWDCPCHGARYDIDGRVLTGPAVKNLTKINHSESE